MDYVVSNNKDAVLIYSSCAATISWLFIITTTDNGTSGSQSCRLANENRIREMSAQHVAML